MYGINVLREGVWMIRILAVDDEEEILTLIKNALSREGCNCIELP